MKETDLYQPVKELLESLGYHVKGEIGSLDVFGVRGEQTIAVELKTIISLKLIYQAIDRQKLVNKTYIAVPYEALKSHRKQIKSFYSLIKRLGIGLIEVKKEEAKINIEISDASDGVEVKKNSRKRKSLIKEFNNRQNNQNLGGTQGKKITAYKEKVIRIANMLEKMGTASPKMLKEHTGIDDVQSILTNNYEGWFNRVVRGQYTLSDQGIVELKKLLKVIDIN
jgi:hypothetical protein